MPPNEEDELHQEVMKNIKRRNEIMKTLVGLEEQIYNFETTYLEETAVSGNVIRGFGPLRDLDIGEVASRTRSHQGPGPSRGPALSYHVHDSDRLFSLSSVTSPASRAISGIGQLNNIPQMEAKMEVDEKEQKQPTRKRSRVGAMENTNNGADGNGGGTAVNSGRGRGRKASESSSATHPRSQSRKQAPLTIQNNIGEILAKHPSTSPPEPPKKKISSSTIASIPNNKPSSSSMIYSITNVGRKKSVPVSDSVSKTKIKEESLVSSASTNRRSNTRRGSLIEGIPTRLRSRSACRH